MSLWYQNGIRDEGTSMGPPSENGGYAEKLKVPCSTPKALQWVHRPRTVVMPGAPSDSILAPTNFNGSTVRERWLCRPSYPGSTRYRVTSMGPPSENGGYVNAW